MPWDQIIGQRRIVDALKRTHEGGRIAHAYLFYGPSGCGKRAVAMAFAKALQCEQPTPPCGVCPSCTKVARMVHPDVQLMMPYPKGTDTHDVVARLQRLAEEPYSFVDYVQVPNLSDPSKSSNKQVLYTVNRINEELRRSMSYRPVEGRYKIAILTQVEQLRIEAANAFLKLLEEPGARTIFVLTATRIDKLLPTIISRCQKLRFEPLSSEDIRKALQVRHGVSADQAALLSRVSNGSFGRALALRTSDELLQIRTTVINFFRAAYLNNILKISDLADEISRAGREPLKQLLNAMMQWTRDLMLHRTMGEEAPLLNIDQQVAIARFNQNVPNADLEAMIYVLKEAQHLAERNVHLGLLLRTLAQRLGHIMHGRSDAPLYLPLDQPRQTIQFV